MKDKRKKSVARISALPTIPETFKTIKTRAI